MNHRLTSSNIYSIRGKARALKPALRATLETSRSVPSTGQVSASTGPNAVHPLSHDLNPSSVLASLQDFRVWRAQLSPTQLNSTSALLTLRPTPARAQVLPKRRGRKNLWCGASARLKPSQVRHHSTGRASRPPICPPSDGPARWLQSPPPSAPCHASPVQTDAPAYVAPYHTRPYVWPGRWVRCATSIHAPPCPTPPALFERGSHALLTALSPVSFCHARGRHKTGRRTSLGICRRQR